MFYTASQRFFGIRVVRSLKTKMEKRFGKEVFFFALSCPFTPAVTKINAVHVLRAAEILVGRLTGDGSLFVCVFTLRGALL